MNAKDRGCEKNTYRTSRDTINLQIVDIPVTPAVLPRLRLVAKSFTAGDFIMQRPFARAIFASTWLVIVLMLVSSASAQYKSTQLVSNLANKAPTKTANY
jgi:hypothetical protein